MGVTKQLRLERALMWESHARSAFCRADQVRFRKLAKHERELATKEFSEAPGGNVAQVFSEPGYETSLSASNRASETMNSSTKEQP